MFRTLYFLFIVSNCPYRLSTVSRYCTEILHSFEILVQLYGTGPAFVLCIFAGHFQKYTLDLILYEYQIVVKKKKKILRRVQPYL